jgi:hypothetical protein
MITLLKDLKEVGNPMGGNMANKFKKPNLDFETEKSSVIAVFRLFMLLFIILLSKNNKNQ